MPYFERVGATTFRPTEHVRGAWDLSEQHISPALGLLAHLVEVDRDERGAGGLHLSRLSYDILGTVPVEDVETFVRLVRPGRSINLVEAELCHSGRPAVMLRAWLMARAATAQLEGSDLAPLPAPDALSPWDPTTVWPGGFIASAEVRRDERSPGHARFWVRTDVPLLDEPVSPTARAIGLLDIANGMTVRVDPESVAFPNVDLTAHFFREPRGGWLGFDTTVSFGATGLGLTSSVLHDVDGALGALAQTLTLRPLG